MNLLSCQIHKQTNRSSDVYVLWGGGALGGGGTEKREALGKMEVLIVLATKWTKIKLLPDFEKYILVGRC